MNRTVPRIVLDVILSIAAVALALALAGCGPEPTAPDEAGTQLVEVEGWITAVTAADGSDRSYALDVSGQGLLAIDIPDARPPTDARGVVLEVPDDADIPTDPAAEFAALTAIVEQTGDPLAVVDYLR